MTNKEKYRNLCKKETTIPIFSQDWWLDVVCEGGKWDVAIVEKGGNILACMPYYIKKKGGFTIIDMPPLTQTLGPWVTKINAKYATKIGQEKDFFQNLIAQLPQYHYFNQSFNFTISNWLPFYWKGFKQTTKYTYRLENILSLDDTWKDILTNIRTDIRKAKEKFQIKVSESDDIKAFYQINSLTFKRQNLPMPYSYQFIQDLDNACKERKCRKILFGTDKDGKPHAAVYLVWDDKTMYYLMGGGDPDLRSSGATSLLIWQSLHFAVELQKDFDFEGSMLEPVERFVRSFGARQTPYMQVTRSNSILLELFKTLKSRRV